MSVEAMSLVLNNFPEGGTKKLVMLGIANHDGNGGSWPSISTLARYSCTSERSVQRTISILKDEGWLSVEENAGGTFKTRPGYRPNLYLLNYDRLAVTPDASVTPGTESRGDTHVTPDGLRGDTGGTSGVTPVSPEPSYNHPPLLTTFEEGLGASSHQGGGDVSTTPASLHGGDSREGGGGASITEEEIAAAAPQMMTGWRPGPKALQSAKQVANHADIELSILSYRTWAAKNNRPLEDSRWLTWFIDDEKRARLEYEKMSERSGERKKQWHSVAD